MMSERDRVKAALDGRIQGVLAAHFADVHIRIHMNGMYEVVGYGEFDAQPAVGYALLTATSRHRNAGKQWSVTTPGQLLEALNEILGWVRRQD